MFANRKGSGETVLIRRLVLPYTGRLCDKYPSLMCRLYISAVCFHSTIIGFMQYAFRTMPLEKDY